MIEQVQKLEDQGVAMFLLIEGLMIANFFHVYPKCFELSKVLVPDQRLIFSSCNFLNNTFDNEN